MPHRRTFALTTSPVQVAVRDVRGDELLRSLCRTQRTVHLYFTTGRTLGTPLLRFTLRLMNPGEALSAARPDAMGQGDSAALLRAANILIGTGRDCKSFRSELVSGEHAAAVAVLSRLVARERYVPPTTPSLRRMHAAQRLLWYCSLNH